jgi:hypothetical protein
LQQAHLLQYLEEKFGAHDFDKLIAAESDMLKETTNGKRSHPTTQAGNFRQQET